MKTGNLEQTLQCLQSLGFTEYEGKIYLSLLAQHPASAYTISRHSGVPHARVYDVARRLAKRGLAVSAGVRPELFSPLSPDELIRKLRREYQFHATQLKTRLDAVHFAPDFDPVWNLPSREKALEMAAELIKNARRKVCIGLWAEDFDALRAPLQSAHNRKARVFILLYGNLKINFGQVYYHGIEHMPDLEKLGRNFDCVVDSTWCITGTLGGRLPSQVVWTRNLGLVQSIESYMAHDFYLAEITRRFGHELDRLFGRNFARLRRKFR